MRKWLLLCGWLLVGPAWALQPGEAVQPWTLLDQFDSPYTLDEQAKVLLVARDMAGGKLVKAALSDQEKGFLEARQVVFVADISRMPGPVSTLFAVPAMRDYPYRVMLDREPRVVPRYPAREGAVLWLRLDAGRLKEVRYYDEAQGLAQALEALPAQ